MNRPVGTTTYSVDDNFFSTPNELNCYWAGFLAADGTLTIDRNNVKLALSDSDVECLENFKDDICFDGPIRSYPFTSVVEVYSKQWRDDLESIFNITPQKTLTLLPPRISNELAWCFIVGYIDGDGWITKTRDKVTIGCQGTENVLKWIQFYFDKLAPSSKSISAKPNKRRDSNCYQYVISGERAETIINYVLGLDIPFMNRKWRRYYE